MRLGLQRFTGRPAKSQPLRTGPTGKPECVGGPAVSVSHSGHLVACAIAPTGQIGVDIELPLRRRRTDEIASQYFSPRESDWLRGQPCDRFYMLWVLKEAYLKATGLGFAGGLDALECRVDPPNIASRAADAGAEPALALYGVGAAFLGDRDDRPSIFGRARRVLESQSSRDVARDSVDCYELLGYGVFPAACSRRSA